MEKDKLESIEDTLDRLIERIEQTHLEDKLDYLQMLLDGFSEEVKDELYWKRNK